MTQRPRFQRSRRFSRAFHHAHRQTWGWSGHWPARCDKEGINAALLALAHKDRPRLLPPVRITRSKIYMRDIRYSPWNRANNDELRRTFPIERPNESSWSDWAADCRWIHSRSRMHSRIKDIAPNKSNIDKEFICVLKASHQRSKNSVSEPVQT